MISYKIFQIGFNRCGTTSLYNFFKHSCSDGLLCAHWENHKLAKILYRKKSFKDTEYQDYHFFSDMEGIVDSKYHFAHMENYRDLDLQYPNSKFILNTRNINKWILSRLSHYSKKYTFKKKHTIQKTL